MGAGPTHRQIVDARRRILQKAAWEYGGRYISSRFDTGQHRRQASFAEADGWCLITRLIRASNGEAALMFMAYVPGSLPTVASQWELSYAEAFKQIGIEPK